MSFNSHQAISEIMADINNVVFEMQAAIQQNLVPSVDRRRQGIEKNELGMLRFGSEGTIVIGYLANGSPRRILVILMFNSQILVLTNSDAGCSVFLHDASSPIRWCTRNYQTVHRCACDISHLQHMYLLEPLC